MLGNPLSGERASLRSKTYLNGPPILPILSLKNAQRYSRMHQCCADFCRSEGARPASSWAQIFPFDRNGASQLARTLSGMSPVIGSTAHVEGAPPLV